MINRLSWGKISEEISVLLNTDEVSLTVTGYQAAFLAIFAYNYGLSFDIRKICETGFSLTFIVTKIMKSYIPSLTWTISSKINCFNKYFLHACISGPIDPL